MDNVHADSHAVFQPQRTKDGYAPPKLVRSIIDLDLDTDGSLTARHGVSPVLLAAGLHSPESFGEYLIVQQDGTIARIDPSTASKTVLVDDLSATRIVQFVHHADQLLWSNGEVSGRIIEDGTAANWGCEVCPPPSLSVVQGGLEAGLYLVSAAYLDAYGIEHGSSAAAPIMLAPGSGIRVHVPAADASAVAVRVYVGGPDDPLLFWHSDVPCANFPMTVSSLPNGDTQAWTIGLSPPSPAQVLISCGDYVVLGVGNMLYGSLGPAFSLFDMGLETPLPGDILAGAGFSTGFWCVTAKDAYWVTGQRPQQWHVTPLRSRTMFARGSLVAHSSLLPGLSLPPTIVALFLCQWGLAVGLPDGSMLFPTKGRYHVDVTNLLASFQFSDHAGFQQLVIATERLI
jgi:hypothetical protein